MSGGHMGFADRGIVPRAISAIYSEVEFWVWDESSAFFGGSSVAIANCNSAILAAVLVVDGCGSHWTTQEKGLES